MMNILLWILQIVFGLYFFAVGVMHFSPPPGLPTMMSWMYELPAWLHYLSGILEIIGGIGLIVPALLRRRTDLVPYSALLLAAVMLGAVIYHLTRGEFINIGVNVLNILILLFIYFGRTRLSPLKDRDTPAVV